MIENPFINFSNRKSQPFQNLFFEYKQYKKSDMHLFSSFKSNKMSKYVADFILRTYKDVESFKKHTYEYNDNEKVSMSDFYNLAVYFKKAARETAGYMVKESRICDLDTLFFTMVYLYRQSIELLLKASIFKVVKDNDSQQQILKEYSHDLGKLYEKLLLISNESNLLDSQRLWLQEILNNIAIFDRASDSFRYPFRITYNKLFGKYEYEYEYVFKNRNEICINKLVNKLEIIFEMLVKDLSALTEIEVEDIGNIGMYKKFSTEFLEEGGEYYAKSVVGYTYNKCEIKMYANAYKKVADHLFSLTLGDSINGVLNFYFLPIMYLYQNAIELAMKELCLSIVPNEMALKTIFSKKHNIDAIWKVVKEHFSRKVGSDIPKIHQLQIEEMIKTFSESHINTSTFRYPCDKSLNKHFKKGYKFHIGYTQCALNCYFTALMELCYLVDEALSEKNFNY